MTCLTCLWGVATTLHSAVAVINGVLARGEEDGGARGEELVRAGPESPIYATLRTERAKHGLLAAGLALTGIVLLSRLPPPFFGGADRDFYIS